MGDFMNKYGFYFALNRCGIWLMINGKMFSFFKGCNSGRWKFSIWDNYRRQLGLRKVKCYENNI
jgi:hypothetical protein